MKKIFIITFLLFFFMVSVGHCGLLNRWGQTDLNRLLGKVLPGYLQSIGTGMTSGVTSITSTTTAIPLSYGYVKKAICTDPLYTTGTLANGTPGQLLTILISGTTGTQAGGTFTLTPTTAYGFTSIYFDANYDEVTLWYADDIAGWVIIAKSDVDLIGPR